jgi:DNA-binding winged helix-turn-helix (wHTH) protein
MSDTSTRQAAAILRQYLQGDVSYQVAQARVRRRGYSLDDPALAAALRRQDEAERAEAEPAAARRGQQNATVNAYIRKEHERTKGITIDRF